MPIRLTPAVKALLIAIFVTFLVQQTVDQFLGGHLLFLLGLIPAAVINHFALWQLFTYSFIHGDVMHLFLNLLMLAFIGGEIEAAWGTARFLRYYFFCATSAALFYLVLQAIHWEPNTPLIGASGAIYGILMAYGLIFGERMLLFMMIFPMKAKHFVWVLAAVEFLSSVFSGRGGIPSIAHLGGMAAGFGFLWGRAAWAVSRKRRAADAETNRRAKKRASSHLKLILPNQEGSSGPQGPNDSDDDSDDHPKTWH
jgi:membrane associated rhomboid family serine protease